MNIFILDSNLKKSAEMLCDQHLNKQILELAQIICTVTSIRGGSAPYKPTHTKHPVTIWASDNLPFCWRYFYFLVEEWYHRSGKYHKSFLTLKEAFGVLVFAFEYEAKHFPIPNGIELMNKKFKEWLSREKPLVPKWTKRTVPNQFENILKDTYVN